MKMNKTLSQRVNAAVHMDSFDGLVGGDGTVFLGHLLHGPSGKLIHQIPFLRRFLHKPSEGVWKLWGVQRYHAAHSFIDFLEGAKHKAEEAGLVDIAQEVAHNLNDERGLSRADGVTPNNSGDHESWRKTFYDALGVDDEVLQGAALLPSTLDFAQGVQDIIENGDVWEHLGALDAVESMVPLEFMFVRGGMKNSSNLVDVFNRDTRQGRENGLYIYHHIEHDMLKHAPDFLNVVLKCFADNPDKEAALDVSDCFEDGRDKMIGMRMAFYAGLEREVCANPVIYAHNDGVA